MISRSHASPHRVVIAGAGAAGLEALAALRALAGDRVDITLLDPGTSFTIRADAVAAAFGREVPAAHDIAGIATDLGAHRVPDALRAVRREDAAVLTRSGRELRYDSLLLAVGATAHPALHDALTFRGAADVPALRALLADVEAGRLARLAFVVPSGTTWALPLYELALLTAERTRRLGLGVELAVLTPESSPAAVLGRDAGHAIATSLAERGIAVHHGVSVLRLEDDALVDVHGRIRAHADRVVALPALTGPRTRGLPHDTDGFIPVDEQGAVRGVPGVWAAGDATMAPYKQGGLAAQQADAAARAIARAAGADVEVPRIPRKLLAHAAAGDGPTWFEAPATRVRPHDAGMASDVPLWWPPEKVAMPYLGAYLADSAASR